ncbi:hypothetical protein BDN67DRAFT_909119 [Paxillus ammoniavirescens]|nr:hypothetical protein BDN67DRAFT_909119 [Paxillus ammoniavirescens]
MLLWIASALSPLEIREHILNPTLPFQTEMVQYLESSHIGEFLTGSLDDVRILINKFKIDETYVRPTETMAEPPPLFCNKHSKGTNENCLLCNTWIEWFARFKSTVDDLLFRCSIHHCSRTRFPRETYPSTFVDTHTGALLMKKGEPIINIVTDIITYIFHCNTDVTSLLSGTAIKAVVAYVTDYITKSSLCTYTIFDTVRSVIDQNSELLGGNAECQEKTRKIMTQIVNSLTAKQGIGAPMACLYLLGF